MTQKRKVVIWKFLDGRPGHENQVMGLVDSIRRRIPCDEYSIRSDRQMPGWKALLPGALKAVSKWPAPDLLIGAGHATHLPVFRCGHRFGGHTVLVMKPSLPVSLFDLCFVPKHDRLICRYSNVVRFEGALNRIQPSHQLDDQRGLILVGGPSRHFDWSTEGLLDQVHAVLKRSEVKSWTVVTSERTPVAFVDECRSRFPLLSTMTPEMSSRDWLSVQLSQTGVVWVTCDSVSMTYEAMTAGAKVGLLELRPKKSGRLVSNVDRLLSQQQVVSWTEWMNGRNLKHSHQPFFEADRCAAEVIQRLLQAGRAATSGDHHPVHSSVSVNLNPLV